MLLLLHSCGSRCTCCCHCVSRPQVACVIVAHAARRVRVRLLLPGLPCLERGPLLTLLLCGVNRGAAAPRACRFQRLLFALCITPLLLLLLVHVPALVLVPVGVGHAARAIPKLIVSVCMDEWEWAARGAMQVCAWWG